MLADFPEITDLQVGLTKAFTLCKWLFILITIALLIKLGFSFRKHRQILKL